MLLDGPLDSVPLPLLFLLTFLLVWLSVEIGQRLGERRARQTQHESSTAVGAMTNATLALLAFLLAFTFSFAASRLETRRTLLLDEVNAIGTTWLRSATLPEPERTQAQELLREYVEVRLAAVREGKLEEGVQRSEALQSRLWSSAALLAQRSPGSVFVALYLQTLNDTIDLHAKRVNEGLRVRIAPVVWVVLLALTVFAMGQTGYQTGLEGSRRPLSVPVFALAFSAVIFLIADLDRPLAGWVSVSQLPMQELLDSMNAPGSVPPQ
jgi:hypothetical protein